MSELIGKTVGGYEILEQVGRGGMSSVYRARDKANGHDVALKVLAPQLAMDGTFRERFKREAKVLSELKHPNIVPILDYGEENGLTFIVLPFMRVGSLNDLLQDGPLDVRECSPLIKQVASALKHAHDSGVIHRDVKPSNILMDVDEKAWLSDFGFAHVHDASLSLTGSALIGTPAYMSPEQVQGDTLSASSDQYALGMIVYQITTGYLPYEAETPMATAIRQVTEPLPRPRWLNPELPDAVEQVIKRALSKKPGDRYESVVAFHDALEEAIEVSYDPETGDLLPGAVGEDPVTEVFESDLEAMEALKPWYARMSGRVALLLLLLAIPLTAWAASAFRSDASGRALSVAQTEVWDSIMASATAGGGISTEDLPTVIAANLTALAVETQNGNTATPSGPEAKTLAAIALASSQPSATLTPTETSTPTITSTVTPLPPTWTSSPQPTRTNPPPPPPPPPTKVNVCSQIKMGEKTIQNKKVSRRLKNNSSGSITISLVRLSWPGDGGNAVRKIVVGDKEKTVNDSDSPTEYSGVGLRVPSGGSASIQFHFESKAEADSYGFTVIMTNGCKKG
ncbi:MAG: protein kinase [Anaerolineales bacterium]|nr:protein kinase [Anaerolineales bacterium]